jgi:HAD superfamily hydrolase (TIGR01549 family)
MKQTRYETAFLDAGGVLIFPNWQRASDVLARHGVLVDPDAMAAAEPAAKKRLDVGPTVQQTNDEERGFLFFDLILAAVGVTPSPASDAALAELRAFHDVENTWDYVPDGTVASLQRLREHGLRIVIVSNSNATIKKLFTRIGLAAHVDGIIDSAEEGIEKPDPQLFRIAWERYGADPQRTIHCGDLYEIDIVGAHAAGLPAVLLDAADMYGHVTACPRVRSLDAYTRGLVAGQFD